MADPNSLRQPQPQRSERDERRRPCDGCGYVFDHESLGKYGCPNCEGDDVPDADSERLEEFDAAGITTQSGRIGRYVAEIGDSAWWATERGLDRVAHGVAHRTHRLKALGNGQVPACAAAAWRLLGGTIA